MGDGDVMSKIEGGDVMAKCVKNTSTGQIKRISDEEAKKLVKSGKYVYCPKSEYQKAGENIMNATTLRKTNHIVKIFEHNVKRMINNIDYWRKSKEADPDTMKEKYSGTDNEGNRSWGPFT